MKIGLVLSGGGSRGIAHLGVIKFLEELQIPIAAISGSSSGAIAGALYSYGYTPEEVLEIIKEIKLLRLIKPAISKTGLLRMEATETLFRKYIKDDDFSALKIPLTVTTTDLCKGKSIFFTNGELIRPLMAGACIPVIFDPIRIGHDWYVDGGILNNFPTKPLVGQCDKIIGSHSNPVDETFRLGNVRSMFERTFLLAINGNSYHSVKDCDIFLEPPGLKKVKVFDLSIAGEIFKVGYEYARSREKDLLRLLDHSGTEAR